MIIIIQIYTVTFYFGPLHIPPLLNVSLVVDLTNSLPFWYRIWMLTSVFLSVCLLLLTVVLFYLYINMYLMTTEGEIL